MSKKFYYALMVYIIETWEILECKFTLRNVNKILIRHVKHKLGGVTNVIFWFNKIDFTSKAIGDWMCSKCQKHNYASISSKSDRLITWTFTKNGRHYVIRRVSLLFYIICYIEGGTIVATSIEPTHILTSNFNEHSATSICLGNTLLGTGMSSP